MKILKDIVECLLILAGSFALFMLAFGTYASEIGHPIF